MTAEGQPERIVRPEEVAWAITQLAAPAASFVTGVVLPDDGGAVVPHTVTANPPSLRNSDSRLREVASFTPRTEPGRPRHGGPAVKPDINRADVRTLHAAHRTLVFRLLGRPVRPCALLPRN
ncbi:hypothetical protein GCM10010251_68830 [Streptomyces aurantiogriseus]|uniref:Uncharacterized protein n=1 Tax=Streptomyces aurantiogriseus TaxID=66870 RepID=A0A918FJG7_9ACTN|nr:hypothetical protein GCM10010251_68830 [Streptomyces aurantiogriseus]